MLKYETYVLGDLETNCYLMWDEDSKESLVIDPADDGVSISEEIIAKGLKPKGVLLTHGHFDHVLGALDLKLIYDIPIYCSSKDLFLLQRQDKTVAHFLGRNIPSPNIKEVDKDLENINKVTIGKEELEVIKTPGHTPGSVCFYNKNNGLLFSGDTLFYQSRGRTDLSYSSTKKIYESLKTLIKLPKDTLVLSGHGIETTIGEEAKRYI
jgi:glyoxylase-like metal-dependent hydrolase (beta-lactamase superfamily II)